MVTQPEPAPSPAPWMRVPTDGNRNGAILIVDRAHEIIGWATDAAGHTTEDIDLDRRSVATISANAARMILAPQMEATLRLLAAGDVLDIRLMIEARRQAANLIYMLDDGLPLLMQRAPNDSITGGLRVIQGGAA